MDALARSPHPPTPPPRVPRRRNCYYCPNEPGQPRSYLHDEPSVLRANRNAFDPVRQFTDRCVTLAMNGHPVDKIELLVLGGTWTSYPHEYQEGFIRDLFYAANTFHSRPATKRAPLSLDEEKAANEAATVKIIGITLETRPDCIDRAELLRMRRYGCTRVQVGMQHTDDGVLAKINRGSTHADMVRAVRLLKDACYKLDIHIMPNLPGASVDLDKAMFERVLGDEELQADQWKIYPCEVTPWTVIKKWFEEGSYVPYGDGALAELLLDVLPRIPPWVRVNRVVRDIPSQYILAGMDRPNLRQDLDTALASRGTRCQDIRTREVKGQRDLTKAAELALRTYHGSGATEHFISFETADRATIFAFARLRLGGNPGGVDDGQSHVTPSGRKRRSPRAAQPAAQTKQVEQAEGSDDDGDDDIDGSGGGGGGAASGSSGAARSLVFPELRGAALVRELHVYGQLSAVDEGSKEPREQQHAGLGTRLMRHAETLAAQHGYAKVAVISGVGVRSYYRKLGYALEPGAGEFMVKRLSLPFRLRHHRFITTALHALLLLLLPVALAALAAHKGVV